MKTIKHAVLALLGLLATSLTWGATDVYNDYLVNETVLPIAKDYVLDLKTAGNGNTPIDQLSVQAVYSSATPSAVQFTDGQVSTFSLTVNSVNDLVGVQASGTITVISTQAAINSELIINGVRLRAGYDYFVGADTNTTASDIGRIVNYIAGLSTSVTNNVVTLTADSVGTAGNSITMSGTTTAFTLSGATLSGGKNNATVTIKGVTLTQGTDWTKQTTASMTAKSISDAIMAKTALSSVMSSTWNASGVVTATSTSVGSSNNFTLASSTPTALTFLPASAAAGGANAAWTINTANITKASHGLSTGLPVLYTTGAVAIGGLTNGTTYFAIRVDANNFKLADTSTNAVAGTGIVLTSSATPTATHTYTLTPLAISGTFGFKFQVSNDNSNWTDLTTTAYGVSVSSITFGSPYTAGSTIWNLGDMGYRYFKVKTAAGSQGGWTLQVIGNGKND